MLFEVHSFRSMTKVPYTFQSEFSTDWILMLPLSVYNILLFSLGHPVSAEEEIKQYTSKSFSAAVHKSGRKVALSTNFSRVANDIWGSSVRNLVHSTR